jgi:hypothetical protein
MRYILAFLVLTLFAIAQGAPPADQPPSPDIPTDQENARKAKAVLEQAIEALGGQAYLKVTGSTQEGRSYNFHHGETNSVGTPFWRFKKFPDKDRLELTKKRDIIEIFNGDKGYEVTYKGVRNLEEKDELTPYLRRRHFSLDMVLRRWLNEPGVALFYEGQTLAAQKQADQVTVMNAKNEAVTVFIDSSTHLPVKKRFTWRDPVDKQRNVEEEVFDNYRQVQGIMTAFDITRQFNGEMSAQSFLTNATYDQAMDDSLFNPQTASIASNKRR